jgi:alpha-galactosidase
MASETSSSAWRLDTPGQTLVFAARDRHLPCVVYWGAPLPPGEDLLAFASSRARPRPGALADYTPELSICPEQGRGYHGQCGIEARDPEGRALLTQFLLTSAEAENDRLTFTASDEKYGLTFAAVFTANAKSGIIEAESSLESSTDMRLEFLSAPVMAIPENTRRLIEYEGRWTQEFGEREVPLTRGVHLRRSRRGRTGHDHFPAMLFPQPGCTWMAGEVYGVHLGFSGAHQMAAERLTDGRLAVLAAIAEPMALQANEPVSSGKLFLAFSNFGRNGLAHAFQTHVRNGLVRFPDKSRPRPVHYNSWEAVYFRHDMNELKELASRAASLGAERFVLDDGWFGKRDDDTSGLGDFFVDARKYPNGLKPLIDHVMGHGMGFGIWVEPEMINPDSDLARAHPEWIIAPEGREQFTARNQHVLDLSNPEVCEWLFVWLDKLLTENRIEYLKWDMNRDLTLAVDRKGFGLLRRHVEAVYALMDRLTKKHPHVEIESCASGGARIDFGILAHTHRVWLSDSNDAHERWIMQNSALQFLPPEIIGSHVGPRKCHTSGRILPMAFRALVAASGHMGFEMDLRELTEAEESALKRWTAFYKTHRGLMHSGRQYRLETPTSETLAQMTVSNERTNFLLFSGSLESLRDETVQPLCLAGLDPSQRYRLKLLNADQLVDHATRHFPSPLLDGAGLVLSGAALMQAGIVLPFAFPQTMWVVEGKSVEKP